MKHKKKSPILAIEKGEKIFIPKKFHKIHDLCAIIYDQLTEIYVDSNYKTLFSTDSDFKENDTHINELKRNKIHVLDWLKINNKNEEIELTLTKHITGALVSDFINFIFESMHCAKRGKMTVAYALLRKPLTDELLILEQLLSDRSKFIDDFFHSGNPSDYDPSNRAIDELSIIKKTLETLKSPVYQDAQFIYDLRYDKTCELGLNAISNHALHIVTRDKHYRTGDQNLNFIFSQEDDTNEYYEHYYFLVPYLLIYSVSIIDKIIFSLLTDEDNQKLKIVKELRRLIGFLLLNEYRWGNKMNNVFKGLSKGLIFECPNCSKKSNLKKSDFILFFETELFICSNCSCNILTKDNICIIKSCIQV